MNGELHRFTSNPAASKQLGANVPVVRFAGLDPAPKRTTERESHQRTMGSGKERERAHEFDPLGMSLGG
jgi:hypothetical protein